jgi:riboflavin-specific deaminase-like protein
VPERPHVVFNFVTTLDGRATIEGSSRALGGPEDLETLLSLRAGADAVLIGPGTVRAEGYGRLVGPQRRASPPPAVLISRSFAIPWHAGLFEATDQPVIVYGPAGSSAPEVAAPVEVVELEDVTPAAALHDLHARGVRLLLSEGGPTLFRALLADGLVDELCLTLAPVITASHETGLVEGGALPEVAHFSLTSVRQAGDELLLRYAIVR